MNFLVYSLNNLIFLNTHKCQKKKKKPPILIASFVKNIYYRLWYGCKEGKEVDLYFNNCSKLKVYKVYGGNIK